MSNNQKSTNQASNTHRRSFASIAGIAALLVIALTAGCTGGKDIAPAESSGKEAASFELHVSPDSFIGGASAEAFSISENATADLLEVTVYAEQAEALKAVYFELEYDAKHFTPLNATATDAMKEGGELLELAQLNERGKVHFGQVQANWPKRDGFSGSAAVAKVQFARKPFTAATARQASAPPQSDYAAAVLEYDTVTELFTWLYTFPGDYDQNGEVNISDLTPLGANFNAAGPFDPASAIWMVDGDQNGLISIADITPIGANFGSRITGYKFYTGLPEGYPVTNDAPAANNFPTFLIMNFDLGDGSLIPGMRRSFQFLVQFADPNAYFWVRPFDGDTPGTPSSAVRGSGNKVPRFKLSVQPTSGALPLETQWTVEATDLDGTIAQYDWDFDGDLIQDETGISPTVNHTYMTDGTYNARVTVRDDMGAEAIRTVHIVAGTGANLPPVAVITPSATIGDTSNSIDLDITGSMDPDGAVVLYEYDWEGDGVIDYSFGTPSPSILYTLPGNYTLEFRVTDNGGAQASDFVNILINEQ